MITPRLNATLCSPKQAVHLSKTLGPLTHHASCSLLGTHQVVLRHSSVSNTTATQRQSRLGAPRCFSTTSPASLRDFFPAKETAYIRQTPAAWPHHGFTEKEMVAVTPGHRVPRTLGDRFAYRLVRFARWCMDRTSGLTSDQLREKNPRPLTEEQWFIRYIFLESVAAVPGMVAGMLRHLHSLRRLRRDNGWIETLLEEAYNERMHLLTFLKMCEPGWFMKFLIIGAQGVYFNAMFIAYLVSPKISHRFVGYLEEEAVHTYTRSIQELEAGHLKKWSDPGFKVPEIAVSYWNMPEGHRTMRDLLYYIRADEANHRGVNHTLGNLNQTEDPNPFVSDYKDGKNRPLPASKVAGFEREEVIG